MTLDTPELYVIGLGITDSFGFGEIQAAMVRLGDADVGSVDRHGLQVVEYLLRLELAVIGNEFEVSAAFHPWRLSLDEAMARLARDVAAARTPADFLLLPRLSLTGRGEEVARAREAERLRLQKAVVEWIAARCPRLLESPGGRRFAGEYPLDDLRREVLGRWSPAFRPRLSDPDLQGALALAEDLYVGSTLETKMVIEDELLVDFDNGPVSWLGPNLRRWFVSYEERLRRVGEEQERR